MLRKLLTAVALFCAPTLAHAATTTYSVGTTCVKIANAGSTVEVQNRTPGNTVYLGTSASGCPSSDGVVLAGPDLPAERRTLAVDLYARAQSGTATVAVVDGFSLGGGSIAPGTAAMTTTEVTVPAATGTLLLPANASRKYLQICNDGTGAARYGYGAAPTAQTGVPLDPGAGAYRQGGCQTLESSSISAQAIYAYSTSGTTFAVTEGQ